METERLILDSIRKSDKEDYFFNISHDKRVLETFICRIEFGSAKCCCRERRRMRQGTPLHGAGGRESEMTRFVSRM